MNPLKHVAIIMDGNGRWGLKNKNSRNAGHRAGLNTVEKIIKETIRNNIKFLTLYAFSTENWKRPKKEINFLFNLLENFLKEKLEELNKQKIRLKIIGKKSFSNKKQIKVDFNPTIDFKIVLLPDKPFPIRQTGLFGKTLNDISVRIFFCSKSTLTFSKKIVLCIK